MSCERHEFLKGICDAPGCEAEVGMDGDQNWFYDADDMTEQARDDDWAAVKRKGKNPLLYCPEHSHWDEEQQERVPNADMPPAPPSTKNAPMEAIAYGIWKADVNMASLGPGELEYRNTWLGLPPTIRDEYLRKAGVVEAEMEKGKA